MSGLPQQFGLGLLEQKEAPQAGLSATPPPSSAAAAADGSSSGGSGNYMTAVGVITAAVVLGTFGTTLLVFHLRRRRALANQQDATRCESRQQDEGEAGGIQMPVVIVTPDNSLHFGWKVSPGVDVVAVAGDSSTDAAATATSTHSDSESKSEQGQAPRPAMDVVTPRTTRKLFCRPPIVVVSVDANYEADRDPEIGGVGQRDEPTTTTAPTEGEADEVSSQQRNHDTVGDHISSKA